MNQSIPVQIVVHDFAGGQFYRHRQVYRIIVDLPAGISWITERSTAEENYQVAKLCAEFGADNNPVFLYKDRGKRVYGEGFQFENGDSILQRIFGLTAMQFFYRICLNQSLWAVRRKDGLWWCKSKLLPLRRLSRKSNECGRIGECEWLFEPMLTRERPDYRLFDLGNDRKPPVWDCNLCGRSAEWHEWPHRNTSGLANSEYIARCPQCGAERGDFFDRVAAVIRNNQDAFCPVKRMQDDYLFTIPRYHQSFTAGISEQVESNSLDLPF